MTVFIKTGHGPRENEHVKILAIEFFSLHKKGKPPT